MNIDIDLDGFKERGMHVREASERRDTLKALKLRYKCIEHETKQPEEDDDSSIIRYRKIVIVD